MQVSSPPWTPVQRYEAHWSHVQNVIIGSNSIATQAARNLASSLGYVPVILTNTLHGQAKIAAYMLAKLAKYLVLTFSDCGTKQIDKDLTAAELDLISCGLAKSDLKKMEEAVSQANNSHKAVCVICGGETTVHVTGTGKGGRNQEMALTFALQLNEQLADTDTKYIEDYHVELLSAGTDGQDGPTDAAGAVVNRDIIDLATKSQLNVKEYLDNNDSYNLFKLLAEGKHLVQTGLTGTNVMDIQILIVQPLK